MRKYIITTMAISLFLISSLCVAINNTGIPEPINYFGYDPYEVQVIIDPSSWPGSEVRNFYFVDPSHENSTDVNNPYGYPEKPRKTFINFKIEGSGKIVLVGDGNKYSIGGAGRFEPVLNGGNDSIIYIEGRYTYKKPELVKELRLNSAKNVIVDGILWTQNHKTIQLKMDSKFVTIRNSSFLGPSTNVGNNSVIAICGNSRYEKASNIVIYNNTFTGFGDNRDSATENDYHGVKPSCYSENIWITDNKCHNMGGDCVQVSDSNTPDDRMPVSIFINGNEMYNTLENCIDIKKAKNVIISENICHTYNRLTADPYNNSDVAIVLHDSCENVYVLNNLIFDVGAGVVNTGCRNANIIGNVIYNVNPVGYYNPNSAYGNGHCIHVRSTISSGSIAFNTCNDYAKGFSFGNGVDYSITGNIISNRNREDGYEIITSNQSDYLSFSSVDHNNYYLEGSDLKFKRGSIINSFKEWVNDTGLDMNSISNDKDPIDSNYGNHQMVNF